MTRARVPGLARCALLLPLCLWGCEPPATTPDVGTDTGALDAPTEPLDAPTDPLDAPTDAPPDTRLELNAREASLAIVCDHRAHGACSGRAGCCSDFAPSPTCEDDAWRACEAAFDPLFRDLDTVTVDLSAFEACSARIAERVDRCLEFAVAESSEPPAPCFDVLEVDVPVGGTCPGEWPASGLPIRCAAGGGICIGGACVATGDAAGEPCLYACGPGLVCAGDTCAPLRSIGEPCGRDAECAAGLCRGGRCGSPGALLDSCTESAQCDVGLVCTGGTCAARAPLTCDPALGGSDCGSQEGCRADARQCSAPRVTGERCVDSTECEAGSFCDLGRCAPRPGEGGPCSDEVCADGLYCWLGACRPFEPEGGPCYAYHCAEGLGCAGHPAVCVPLPGRGERCTDELWCAPGLGCVIGVGPAPAPASRSSRKEHPAATRRRARRGSTARSTARVRRVRAWGSGASSGRTSAARAA